MKIPFRRCMVVVGGSATNFASIDAPSCGTSQPATVIDVIHAGFGLHLSRHRIIVFRLWLHIDNQSTGHVYES